MIGYCFVANWHRWFNYDTMGLKFTLVDVLRQDRADRLHTQGALCSTRVVVCFSDSYIMCSNRKWHQIAASGHMILPFMSFRFYKDIGYISKNL